jgi:hypothetical protein
MADHWVRVMLIFCLVGGLDGYIRSTLLPSEEEFKEVGRFVFRPYKRNFAVALTMLRFLPFFVWARHFITDVIFLTPAVILRFFIVRRPLFHIPGWFLAIIVITDFFYILCFASGSANMEQNLGILLVVFGFYGLLSTQRKA